MATQEYTFPLMDTLHAWGPKFYQALIICVIGIAFAYAFQFISRFVINRAGNANSKIWRHFPSKQVSSVARILSKLIFWLTIFVTLLISLVIFKTNLSGQLAGDVARFIPKLFGGILTLMLGIFISSAIKNIIGSWTRTISYEPLSRASGLVYVLCMTLTVLVVVKQLGFDIEFITSFILVVVGCFFLGTSISFGVGSAPAVTSLLSAFYIRKNIRIGDYIKCDDVEGVLHQVTKTSFIVKNESSIYIIPARRMFSSIVEIKNDK